jgi:hypothetical protein
VYAAYTANADLTVALPCDDTIPQITEGTEIVTASITPKLASSKIRVRFRGFGTNSTADEHTGAALFRDAVSNALTAICVTIDKAGYVYPYHLEFEESAGSVTARTYRIRVGKSVSGTMRFNGTHSNRMFGGTAVSTLVVEEIAA